MQRQSTGSVLLAWAEQGCMHAGEGRTLYVERGTFDRSGYIKPERRGNSIVPGIIELICRKRVT
jgi:hypothetical protein